jgi:hypothetical protein
MADQGRGKLTLLGFAGICPDVQLYVETTQLPLQLAFVLVCGRGAGKFQTAFQLSKDGHGPFLKAGPTDSEILANKSSTNYSFQIIGSFPGAGRYRVELLADGKQQYVSTFDLIQGSPP